MPSGSTPPPTAMQRHAGRLRAPGHAERRLAERGLGVDPALAGDHEVGAGELGVEVGRLHDEVDARAQGERLEAVLDGEQGEPDAAGRAGARDVADPPAGRALELVGDQAALRASSSSTWPGVAPFCGP